MTRRHPVVLAGLALALALPLAAQQGQPPRGGMGRMMQAPSLDSLTALLTLDSAQQAKVTVLLAEFDADLKPHRETIETNMGMVREGAVTMESVREQNMAAMGKIRERQQKLYADLRLLLSPNQQEALDGWVAAQQQRMRGNRPPPK